MSRFRDSILNIIYNLIQIFDTNIGKTRNILAMDLEDGIFSGVFGTVMWVSDNMILPTATSIIAVCFFIEFMKISLKMDMFKWEYAISTLAKFAIARAALSIAPAFLLAIYRIGAGFINSTVSTDTPLSLQGAVFSPITDFMNDLKWQEVLAMSATLVIIFLAVFVVGIFILVMAYARMFEILIYLSVSPLAVAFLPLENSGITKRFILNFAAVVLQGVIMLIIVMIYSSLVGALFETAETGLSGWGLVASMAGTMLVATLTLITAIMKGGSLAKSALGQ